MLKIKRKSKAKQDQANQQANIAAQGQSQADTAEKSPLSAAVWIVFRTLASILAVVVEAQLEEASMSSHAAAVLTSHAAAVSVFSALLHWALAVVLKANKAAIRTSAIRIIKSFPLMIFSKVFES